MSRQTQRGFIALTWTETPKGHRLVLEEEGEAPLLPVRPYAAAPATVTSTPGENDISMIQNLEENANKLAEKIARDVVWSHINAHPLTILTT